MEIILKKDVENLGLEFDTVSVNPGYARNFLIPQGQTIVEQLKKTSVSIAAKVWAGDRLFGSVNNINLAEALANAGINVDKKYIRIPGNSIKRLGRFSAKIRLHREVEHEYEFEIVSDAPVSTPAKEEKKVEEQA